LRRRGGRDSIVGSLGRSDSASASSSAVGTLGGGGVAGKRGGIRRGGDGNARRLWVVSDGEQATLGIDGVNVVYGDEGEVIVVVRWNGWKTKFVHLGVWDDIITDSKGALAEQASLDAIVVQLDTKIGIILAECPCNLNSGISRPSSRSRLSDHKGSRDKRSQSRDGNEEGRQHG